MDTQIVETRRYQDYSAYLHARVIAERIPADVSIEVTRRCPLRCTHCYNNLPMADVAAHRAELTFDEHCRILDELAEAGCLWLLYTGGEVFARTDFLDIHTYAKKKGFLVTIFTNGTLITPRIADYLVEWRPFAIEITLYGATRETYERLTGVPGSYEHCLRGVSLLLERGLPLKLKTVAVSVNKHEIGEMKRFAQGKGLPFKFDAMMNPRIDCSQSPLAVRLQPWEIVKMDLEDPQRVAQWKRFAGRFNHPVPPEHSDEVYQCGGGVNGFAIDPEGKMSICVLSEAEKYDLRRGSLEQGWEHFLHRIRGKKATRVTKCTACEIKSMCGMCPANAELENGDPETPVDFLCHVAHLRAEALGMPVPLHGSCEYCVGGAAYSTLLKTVEFVRSHGIELWVNLADGQKLVPVLKKVPMTGGSGCSLCSG